MDDEVDEAVQEKRKSAYSSRLSRARAFNADKRGGLIKGPGTQFDSPANMAFSIPVQAEADAAAATTPRPSGAGARTAAPRTPSVAKASDSAQVFYRPEEEGGVAAHWEWNPVQKLLALVEHTQLLKVIDETGKTIYRVQLPREGRSIFLGWEPSGAALAAVQDHGGAFLWFPSKPDCVQQWEGMQFSSQVLRSAALKRNSHFDTCFASWSETRKLVLGLADGNFACWDLGSNETFISRKHFAGKHKGAITCGCWGSNGLILALGSKNQLKISRPLLNASWESTAIKLALPDNELSFQELQFSPSGQSLSALAGTSIFRHLCLYNVSVDAEGTSKERRDLMPVGEMRPDATIGGIQAVVWLDNEMLAAVTTNGYLRLLQYNQGEGLLLEDQHKPCDGGVSSACLCKRTGHLAIITNGLVTFFDPLLLETAATLAFDVAPEGVRYTKLQACSSGETLLLGRTDGIVLRIKIPEMPKADLTLLTIRRRATEAGSSSGGGGASNTLYSSCGTPIRVCSMTAADGATSGHGERLFHAWSQTRGLLAIVNGRGWAIVMQRKEDGTTSEVLREKLPGAGDSALPDPDSGVISLSWDPSSQSVLAIAIRHYGIALWDTKGDNGVQMWSGMSYKSFIPLRKSQRVFDPKVASWNLAGQLAVGMHDGSFAVWDSMSMDISTSQSSGKHRSPISACDWYSSLFAPALALASRSTIKVSQGFEGVEWSATSMKLKLGMAAKNSSLRTSLGDAGLSSPVKLASAVASRLSVSSSGRSAAAADPEGLDFHQLKFSPNGRHLAAMAAPTTDANARTLVIYELQDRRNSLVLSREVRFDGSAAPIGMSWLVDHTLVVFVSGGGGGGRPIALQIVSPSAHLPAVVWPPAGTALPGTLIDAAATLNGLLALVFGTSDGRGVLQLVAMPALAVAAEMPLDGRPQSIVLYQPKGSYVSYLSVAFEGGGVEVWELPPADASAVGLS